MPVRFMKDALVVSDRQGNEVPLNASARAAWSETITTSTEFIKSFRTVGCIGDSHMAALITCAGEANKGSFERSWVTQMFKGTDAILFNLAENGMNCITWKEKHLTQMKNAEACEAYVIALGTNDNAGYTADEFYTNYTSVVNEVTAHAPNCAIFCCSIYNYGAYCEAHNAAIERVANQHENCFYLDFSRETGQLRMDGYNTSGHFDGLGHIIIGQVARSKIETIIAENPDFFRRCISRNT